MSRRKRKRKHPTHDSAERPPSRGGTRPRRRIGKSWRAKLILLGAALGIGLLLGEIVVRVSGTAPDVIAIGVSSADNVYRRSTNPVLSFEFKPGFQSDDASVPVHYRRINSHGFRDAEREYAKPPGTKRVILLGDSVVVGYGCEQIDQLMSRQLEELYDGEDVEVLNLAVTGYCTRAEVELLKERGLQYDPDLVILVFVENDFRNFNPETGRVDGIVERPAVVNSLFQASQLFRLTCLEFNWFSFGVEDDPERWNQDAIGDNNVVDGFNLLRELADEHGFEAVVAAWPGFTNGGIEYPAKMFLPDSDALIVERLARARGLGTFGLREAFRDHWRKESPGQSPRLAYTIGDEMHPSPLGHRVAAEALHRFIEQESLLDGKAQSAASPENVPAEDATAAAAAARNLGSDTSDYGLVYVNEANELRQQGKLDEAATALRKVIESDSLFAVDARMVLAVILGEQGKLKEARIQLEKVLEAKPDHAQALAALGMAASQEGKADEAIRLMRRVVELRPELANVQLALGFALSEQERTPEALEHFRMAAKFAPNNVRAVNAWGVALARERRFREAAEQFRHAVRLDPTNEDVQRNLRQAELNIQD